MAFLRWIPLPLLWMLLWQGAMIHRVIAADTLNITKDSLPVHLNKGWLWIRQDSINMSSVAYSDAHWDTVNPSLWRYQTAYKDFTGTAWFRLHFRIDSSLHGKPLSIYIDHDGWSQLYLDGIKIEDWDLDTSDIARPENPTRYPLIIPGLDPGNHLLSVRYTNNHTQEYLQQYNSWHAGFTMYFGMANSHLRSSVINAELRIGITVALGFIFLTFTLLHLLMWLYYRRDRSNLFFSLLTASMAASCLILTYSGFVEDTEQRLFAQSLLVPLIMIIFLALHNFLYTLFKRKRKIWFWLVFAAGIVSLSLMLMQRYLIDWDYDLTAALNLTIIIAVSVHSIILIGSAIRKREPGAKIIGGGILFFVLFLLSLIVVGIIMKEINLSADNWTGRIVITLAAMAILSIPVSMSVYLSWNNAGKNHDLMNQLTEIQLLSARNLEQEQEKSRMIRSQNELLETKVEERTRELTQEKKKSDDLLLNILPEEVAKELKETGKATARLYPQVSVLFTDFENFTGISQQLTPQELVAEIDRCFRAFDSITEQFGLEKIKTIGDAYLAVAGLPVSSTDHAERAIKAAEEMINWVAQNNSRFGLRVGIHSGPVVAGIVGFRKYAFDIWGDTVNTASRMESNGKVGCINVSETTYELVKAIRECTPRGKINVKGKGEIDMYFVIPA